MDGEESGTREMRGMIKAGKSHGETDRVIEENIDDAFWVVLEVETVLRRILWEFCCEYWKGEYAFIYLKCEIE